MATSLAVSGSERTSGAEDVSPLDRRAHALGLPSATALVIGSIIGTGVFTMPAVMAGAGTVSILTLGVIRAGHELVARVPRQHDVANRVVFADQCEDPPEGTCIGVRQVGSVPLVHAAVHAVLVVGHPQLRHEAWKAGEQRNVEDAFGPEPRVPAPAHPTQSELHDERSGLADGAMVHDGLAVHACTRPVCKVQDLADVVPRLTEAS